MICETMRARDWKQITIMVNNPTRACVCVWEIRYPGGNLCTSAHADNAQMIDKKKHIHNMSIYALTMCEPRHTSK